jgi:hypothetical protein
MRHLINSNEEETLDMRNPFSATPSYLSPFSGLGARVARAKAKQENDEKDGDENEDENDDDDGDGDGDGDGKGGKSKKSKKVKKAEDDEDTEDEDKPEARAARLREKRRIRAIVNSPAGQALPAAALRMALDTCTPRHAAIRTLTGMASDVPQGRRSDALRELMASTPQPNIGAGGAEAPVLGDPKSIAAAIIAAGKKRRGEI